MALLLYSLHIIFSFLKLQSDFVFRPTGNLIATSRCDSDKREVIFYERNGQRRSKFECGPHQGTEIDWLGWNTDGNILCIQSKNSEGTAQEGTVLL